MTTDISLKMVSEKWADDTETLHTTSNVDVDRFIRGANIVNQNGGIGHILVFNNVQLNIASGSYGMLHRMENNPSNGFEFFDNYQGTFNRFGRIIRFWIRGAVSATCAVQGWSRHYRDADNTLRSLDGTRITDADTFNFGTDYNKGSTAHVTQWYDVTNSGLDGFTLGIRNVSGGTLYLTQVILEITKSRRGLE